MPSKTFLNLNDTKRSKLISSAMKEFSTVDFPNVSINQIIMNAEISRGSFYTYFDDKEDLFKYIIHINGEKLNQILLNILNQNNGNLEKTFINLYDELISKLKKEKLVFFKNIFFFFNLRREEFADPLHSLFEYVKDYIYISNIKQENLEFVFTLFVHNLFTSMISTLKSGDLKNGRVNYLKHLDIICYGIYKEEK